MLFSKRKGYIKARDVIQIESLDEPTKKLLWTCLYENIVRNYSVPYSKRKDFFTSPVSGSSLEPFVKAVWSNILKEPTDTIPSEINSTVGKIRDVFFRAEWFRVFDIIETAYSHVPVRNHTDPNERSFLEAKYQYEINKVLQQENVGYRMTAGKIIQMTDEIEINEIDLAVKTTRDPVRNHLQEALKFLTDRKNPSFRNSIKESISAIEALAQIKTGDESATLGKLVNKLNLHPALEQGLSKIYGYTSDADGIRHALSKEVTISYEDAKFFLVVCSAFVNLIETKVK